MKTIKFITMLMTWMMPTAFTMAQTFEFQYHGEPVADNETVSIPAVEDEFGFGELCCETNPSSDPNHGLVLKLLQGESANGTATLLIKHNSLDATTVQWCMGGACSLMNNKESLEKQFTVNGSTQIQFDATDIHSEGYLLATLSASIGNETHVVKIEFTNGQSAGVTEMMTEDSGKVNVYDTFGRLLLSHADVSNLNRLPHAIYVIESGKKKHKLLVK